MSVLHTVLLRATPGADIESALGEVRALAALPAVQWLHAGADISVEGLAAGFTHAVVVSFASEADRAAYLQHPAHIAAGESLGKVIDGLAIVDISA